jgi:hypothetical protein
MGASAAFAEATASIRAKTAPTGAKKLWRRKTKSKYKATSTDVAHQPVKRSIRAQLTHS